ncbi:SDR family oxidoreductase [Novosphingobium sp.]|uniref:SDR family NAD(P)-dependent oxidoreductase n=1 Tax=Novosphingobium sp. TaxID=1874826 RepID=UPI0031D0365E
MTTSSKGTALITGASAGIGAVYADRLAKRGYDLILVARNAERLHDIATDLSEKTGRRVETLTADLITKEGRTSVEEILASREDITLLVNNAGFGGVAPLVSSDPDLMEDMIAVNVTALTRLTYAAVPAMLARGHGAIINISSIVAIGPEILNGVYGGSKAFVLAFTQSLLSEVADKGIRVQTVLPGGTATDFWSVAGYGEYAESPKAMPVDLLVDSAMAGFDLGETVTIPPLQDGALWDRFDSARREIAENVAHARPAARYGLTEA